VHKCAKAIALILLPATLALADNAQSPASTSSTNAAPALSDASGSNLTLSLATDVGLANDGTLKDEDSYQVRVGELYAPGGEAYVMAIYITPLPAGQQFKNVHLRMQIVNITNEEGLGNADLYGIGVRDAAKVLPADYYQGTSDTKATLIQANFLTPTAKVRTDADSGPYLETTPEADKALAKFLNDIYSKPENAKKYVFLRISYDVETIPAGNNGYMLLTSRAGGANEQPLISYTLESKN